MALPLVALAGVAALQFSQGLFAAENTKKAAELNQQIAEMNAEFAELDAYDTELEGYSQQAQYQTQVDQTLSDQKTIAAATDIDISYGSAAELVEESRFIANLNKMEIQQQARDAALGFKREARNYRLGGSLNRSSSELQASSQQMSGTVSAIRTGITGYQRS